MKRFLAVLALLVASGLAWAGSVSTTGTVLIISADGSTLTPPASVAAADTAATRTKIVTAEGTWTFGTPPNSSGDYPILLDGANAGWGVLLEVINGKLYVRNKASTYSVRWNRAWVSDGTTGPIQGTVATKLTLTETLPRIPDNSPAGTVIATAAVSMSPLSGQFTGPLVSSNPLYGFHGLNIVLTRSLTSADDGNHPAIITAIQ